MASGQKNFYLNRLRSGVGTNWLKCKMTIIAVSLARKRKAMILKKYINNNKKSFRYIKKNVSGYVCNHGSPRGNETLRPLGVATGNALSVTRSEDTYEKTPPVGRRQPMTSLPACHNISAAGRIHHQLLRLKLASEAWLEA